tara:strand:- start:424 stop:885 length:462 start_codon:yes stop_codon:yes gene_type:complete
MLDISDENNVKKVMKPWGYELWMADQTNSKFAFKKIFIRAPYQSSIQFHEVKEESIFISSGKGILHYSDEKIDIEKFKRNLYSQDEINDIIKNLKVKELGPGSSINVKTGYIHSIEAVQDITIFEASTLELEDVYRLNDKYKRGHGHIESEHK